MFTPVFGRKRQIHYLLGILSEFHMCETTFSSMSGRLLEKRFFKGSVDTGYFPVILSEAFLLYTLFGEVGVDDLLSLFFFI